MVTLFQLISRLRTRSSNVLAVFRTAAGITSPVRSAQRVSFARAETRHAVPIARRPARDPSAARSDPNSRVKFSLCCSVVGVLLRTVITAEGF